MHTRRFFSNLLNLPPGRPVDLLVDLAHQGHWIIFILLEIMVEGEEEEAGTNHSIPIHLSTLASPFPSLFTSPFTFNHFSDHHVSIISLPPPLLYSLNRPTSRGYEGGGSRPASRDRGDRYDRDRPSSREATSGPTGNDFNLPPRLLSPYPANRHSNKGDGMRPGSREAQGPLSPLRPGMPILSYTIPCYRLHPSSTDHRFSVYLCYYVCTTTPLSTLPTAQHPHNSTNLPLSSAYTDAATAAFLDMGLIPLERLNSAQRAQHNLTVEAARIEDITGPARGMLPLSRMSISEPEP